MGGIAGFLSIIELRALTLLYPASNNLVLMLRKAWGFTLTLPSF
jgi:hypothetical protein